jgi:hypothetical protein
MRLAAPARVLPLCDGAHKLPHLCPSSTDTDTRGPFLSHMRVEPQQTRRAGTRICRDISRHRHMRAMIVVQARGAPAGERAGMQTCRDISETRHMRAVVIMQARGAPAGERAGTRTCRGTSQRRHFQDHDHHASKRSPSRGASGDAHLQEHEAALHDGHERLVAPGIPVELVRRKLGVGLHVHQLRAARPCTRRREPATGAYLTTTTSYSQAIARPSSDSAPARRVRLCSTALLVRPDLLARRLTLSGFGARGPAGNKDPAQAAEAGTLCTTLCMMALA